MNRVARYLAVFAIVALMWPAKVFGATSSPLPITPLTIDVIASVTGSGAYLNQQIVTAIKAYEAVANASGGIRGQPIHFEIHDDSSVPQVAVSLANQIFAKHPAVILGPAVQATCNAVQALAAHGPVMYCLSPGLLPEANSYVFAASSSIANIVPAMFRYIRTSGRHRLALIVTTDATGQRSDKMIDIATRSPENKSLDVVAYEHFSDADISVAAQVARIKAADPDFIYISASGTPFQTVMRNLSDAGLFTVPIITSTANMSAKMLAPYVKAPPSELVFNGPRFWRSTNETNVAVRNAIAEYRATYVKLGFEQTPNDDFGWDTAKIVVEAFRHLGADATSAQIHDYIENLHGFAGINGSYDFRTGDQHGLDSSSLIMLKWEAAANAYIPVSAPGGVALRKP
jgi:branched-chain amino acid transport system substrate-binding protein